MTEKKAVAKPAETTEPAKVEEPKVTQITWAQYEPIAREELTGFARGRKLEEYLYQRKVGFEAAGGK